MLIVIAESESRGSRTADGVSLLYWGAADDARKAGDLIAAKSLYEVAIDRQPKEFENWYWLGIVERDLAALPNSSQALRRALEIRPGDRDASYWIATNLLDEGRYEEAGIILDELLRRDPSDGRVWYRRGEIFGRQGQCPEAIKHYEKARSFGVDRKKVKERVRECADTGGRGDQESH